MPCRICTADATPFARATVLGRHEVQYFRCPACGYIQTEKPFWLQEAYTRAITDSDCGLLDRNLRYARVARSLIFFFSNRGGRFLDYGGGYGVFTRLMRDQGYDFYRYDKFCPNLFAGRFDLQDAAPFSCELVTAFEVLEHLEDPVEDMRRMMRSSPHLLCSTLLLPAPPPRPDAWWYYGLEHGQHIGLFTPAALQRLAERLGTRVYTNGRDMHLFTPRRLSRALFRVMASQRVAEKLFFTRRPSLLPSDAEVSRRPPRGGGRDETA